MFKVYVPMKEEYKGKTLEAYYINDKDEKEIHKINEEGGYLVFETNHFSEYILGTKLTNNPKTNDNIHFTIISLLFSSLTLIFTIKYLKK